MTTNLTAIVDTISVATSTGSMGASHTGLVVSEYGISMHGNTLGASTHREPFSGTPWEFPEHRGFQVSYTSRQPLESSANATYYCYRNQECLKCNGVSIISKA